MTGEKAGAVALPSLWCKKLKQVGLYKTGLAAASLFGGYCLGELLYVAVNTPRLPEAPGPVLGGSSRTSASSKSIRLLCLGDSVAAGCGLQSNDEACAGVFARATSEALGGRDVTWRVLARNGYTANRIERKHVPRIGSFDPDLVLLSVGVNNLLAMQSSAVFENELTSLLRSIRRSVPAHASVVVMGMPPMSMFVALTPLLRVYAGHKAKQFNEVMAKVCNNLQRELEQEEEEESQDSRFKQIVHIDYQDSSITSAAGLEATDTRASFFAPDGFHPGPKALAFMADHFYEKTFRATCEDLTETAAAAGGAGGHRIHFAKR